MLTRNLICKHFYTPDELSAGLKTIHLVLAHHVSFTASAYIARSGLPEPTNSVPVTVPRVTWPSLGETVARFTLAGVVGGPAIEATLRLRAVDRDRRLRAMARRD